MTQIMNALESPLEALAFNYLSFGILTVVNNLWTWVAVITAAVSFWRIKTAGATSYSPKPEVQPRNDPSATGSRPVPEIISSADSVFELPAPAAASDTVRSSSSAVLRDVKDGGETKGKFTLYYHEKEEESRESEDGELTVVKEWGEECRDGCEEWWERVMRVRVVDMGWHRYQDLTVIDGNIVRFWG
ncbi:hypothetical protein JRO89_XS03G0306500 [Xanthoceras sorbifolium]|uniref:Uncharacterized protein n=1 Tax=Xanthoceras sorbifolium TaxID=99658 RepID=A0ABQ8ICX7_9ROSI|nr:hypothetical protein JRO89_XS03G0306500 [Xanthoceras sorbifolium]